MKTSQPRAFLAVATLLGIAASSSFSQESKSAECSRAVIYEPFESSFAAKMQIQLNQNVPPARGDKQFSPFHTRFMVVNKADFSKPGPWNTAVWIRDAAGKEVPIMLTFTDHGNGDVKLQWLNEKLLYGSVWWGRIVSTDFVFDIESHTFIYREMASYGEFIQPCN